jgi:hypothetical protein
MVVTATVEVRIYQQGQYGQAFTLGDNYSLEINTLSEAAAILVRLHELCDEVLSQQRKRK